MKRRWAWIIGAGRCTVALACVASTPKAQAAGPADGIVRWIGTGTQVYACKRDGDLFVWSLLRPDTLLADASGKAQGTHGAGPSWTASDGSTVFGAVVTAVPAPVSGAIPWLVLRASRHTGNGLMSGVNYVFRTDTEGGTAPIGGCDAAHDGREERKPYRSTYTFLLDPSASETAQPAR